MGTTRTQEMMGGSGQGNQGERIAVLVGFWSGNWEMEAQDCDGGPATRTGDWEV